MSGQVLFLDLETTGLSTRFCSILEVAAVVVSDDLDPCDRFEAVVWKDQRELYAEMDAWCTKTHEGSGLVDQVLHSGLTIGKVDDELAQFVRRSFPGGKAELAGNSVHLDLAFIQAHMPRTAALLSHRVTDVSGMARSLRRFCGIDVPNVGTEVAHRAMADVQQSLDQMKLVRAYARRGLPRKEKTNAA